MSDIQIKIADNVNRESVFINPHLTASDKIIKDADGNITGVMKDSNILSTGKTAREAANKIYGKI